MFKYRCCGLLSDDVANGVVVQHGITKLFDDKSAYDGSKKSELDASLPFEATVPATCGKLAPVTSSTDAASKNFATAFNASATTFSNQASAAVVKLPPGASANQFSATANAATAAYMTEVQSALTAFGTSMDNGSNSSVARDQFMNSYSASKDKLFNSWSAARDTLIDQLNRDGNNEAGNTFSALYNAFSAQLGTSIEMAKNNFAQQATAS